jgi:hypothetical protein
VPVRTAGHGKKAVARKGSSSKKQASAKKPTKTAKQ